MTDAYDNYASLKEKAITTSRHLRTQFSWAKATEKAMGILEELSDNIQTQ